MNTKKGFTIIELIVVIAIIAVLAGIVMVNVTKYIKQSKDAAIKHEMAQLKVAATQYYDEKGFYLNVGGSQSIMSPGTEVEKIRAAIEGQGATSPGYSVTANAYCFNYTLNDGSFYCIDSSGFLGSGKFCSPSDVCVPVP